MKWMASMCIGFTSWRTVPLLFSSWLALIGALERDAQQPFCYASINDGIGINSTQERGELFLERFSGKGFDDVATHPGFDRFNDTLLHRLGSDHKHRSRLELGVGPDRFEQLQPVHVWHIPVRDDHIDWLLFEPSERHGPIFRLHDRGVPQLPQLVPDNAAHRRKVIDKQNRPLQGGPLSIHPLLLFH